MAFSGELLVESARVVSGTPASFGITTANNDQMIVSNADFNPAMVDKILRADHSEPVAVLNGPQEFLAWVSGTVKK